MERINERPGLIALIAFVVGLILGLVVLGWGLFPVEYTGADPSGMFTEYQATYVRNAAELYSFNNNQEALRSALGTWGGDVVACELARASTDPADQQRLIAAATIVNGQGCAGVAAGSVPAGGTLAAGTAAPGIVPQATSAVPAPDTAANGSSNLPLILLVLLLLLLAAAIFYVWNRRRALMAGAEDDGDYSAAYAGTTQKSYRPSARAGAARGRGGVLLRLRRVFLPLPATRAVRRRRLLGALPLAAPAAVHDDLRPLDARRHGRAPRVRPARHLLSRLPRLSGRGGTDRRLHQGPARRRGSAQRDQRNTRGRAIRPPARVAHRPTSRSRPARSRRRPGRWPMCSRGIPGARWRR